MGKVLGQSVPLPQDDVSLVVAMTRGDTQALHAFMARNQRFLRGIIYAVLGRADEVDDVLQRVWVKLWQELGAGALDDPRRWRPWVYQLARNAGIDAARRIARRRKLADRLKDWILGGRYVPSSPAADGPAIMSEQHQAALRAIAAMPRVYREAFILRHLEDWSYQEIADALGVPVDTVETRLVRARRLLRQRLSSLAPSR